jgi:fructokinase
LSTSPLIFGEVLFDCFPDGREIPGGAPFNVAWNLQAFGMQPLLISRIGDDPQGQLIMKKMRNWSMDTSCMQVDSSYSTGMVRIKLNNGEPDFAILPNQAYDYITPPVQTITDRVSFLYHGSLALRSDINRSTLAGLKRDYAGPVFMDVNLRKPWWSRKTVLPLLEDTTWLKLNEDELDALLPGEGDLEYRCRGIRDRFTLDSIFVTRGKRGAVALTRDDRFLSIEPQKDIAVVDTVGAGDAFSSVLLFGLQHNWPPGILLERAQDFASAVVGRRGAITRDRQFYQTFRKKWHLQ